MRLFARDPWTIVSLISSNTFSLEMVALLWQAIHYEMNVIVGGGTGSGKTSSLNSLLALIPSYQRIITIEDTRELVLPKFQWNWVPMVTRPPNPEGLGEVTMLDLVVNSLRMRPDRIIMGEIRRKKEAEVLFEAMHTGHSVYGTIHANTGAQVIKRLIEPPIEVPQSEVEDITLLIVHYRDRRKNLRRALELSEVLPGTDSPKVNQLYHWRPRTDTFETLKEPHRYYEELNLNTGMTQNEIVDDQKKKQIVLDWMVKNNLAGINQVGLVMKDYYSNDSDLVDSIKKKYTPKKIFGDELV
jgi:flagellar protein FlaI